MSPYRNQTPRGPEVQHPLRNRRSRKTRLAHLILREHFHRRPCFDHVYYSVFGRAINLTVRRNQRRRASRVLSQSLLIYFASRLEIEAAHHAVEIRKIDVASVDDRRRNV